MDCWHRHVVLAQRDWRKTNTKTKQEKKKKTQKKKRWLFVVVVGASEINGRRAKCWGGTDRPRQLVTALRPARSRSPGVGKFARGRVSPVSPVCWYFPTCCSDTPALLAARALPSARSLWVRPRLVLFCGNEGETRVHIWWCVSSRVRRSRARRSIRSQVIEIGFDRASHEWLTRPARTAVQVRCSAGRSKMDKIATLFMVFIVCLVPRLCTYVATWWGFLPNINSSV
jgi:hypothetical protein